MRAAPEANHLPVIHIAPERGLAPFMRARYGATWTPVDFNPERYQKGWVGKKVRFCDLSEPTKFFKPASVRGFLHSHVLEHIPAPLDQVLPAMNAAVAPGGFHAFIVPGHFPEKYDEDLSADLSPEIRKQRFGHPEHMRIFGRSDWDQVVLPFFKGWTQIDMSKRIDRSELIHGGINGSGILSGLTGKTVHLFIKD